MYLGKHGSDNRRCFGEKVTDSDCCTSKDSRKKLGVGQVGDVEGGGDSETRRHNHERHCCHCSRTVLPNDQGDGSHTADGKGNYEGQMNANFLIGYSTDNVSHNLTSTSNSSINENITLNAFKLEID
jgi:hypothetical protein